MKIDDSSIGPENFLFIHTLSWLAMQASTWKLKAKGSRLQDNPELHNEFEAGLNYMRDPVSKQNPKSHFYFEHRELTQLCTVGVLCIIKNRVSFSSRVKPTM